MKKFLIQMSLSLTVVLLFTGCFKTRDELAREKEERESRTNIQQNMVEYNQSFDRMQVEMGKLQGRIEELEFQRKKEMSALNSSREGTDKNVGDLRSKLEELQKGQTALFEEMKKLKEDNLQMLKALSEKAHSASAAPSATGGVQKKNTNASFEAALNSYKSKDCDGAIDGFRAYLESRANAKKAIDAHYYIGDCLFKRKSYNEAIVEFAVVHEKALKSAWGRKSTLKIAESFHALGKNKDAKAFAQILVDSSPQSEEAKKARKYLK